MFTIIIIYGGYNLFLKRTPERILKMVFDISLKDFDYTVETFEEQWCPNGDGYALVIYKFNKLTQENIDYLKGFGLKPLPVSEEDRKLMIFNKIPEEFLSQTWAIISISKKALKIQITKLLLLTLIKK